MEKVRIGVMGAGRGKSMMQYCTAADNAELVAICDNYPPILEWGKKELKAQEGITFYDDFEDFIKHPGMDAVVLANYANEHAPFAIRCMNEGKHVFSEVVPCQTMKEAIELIECVEAHPELTYAYGENYCYMMAPYEMRRIYQSGALGEFEYGEGEYVHNCESIWPRITQGNPDHWRNHLYSTFYCTHSLGPIIHITGLRPVKVSGFETPFNERNYRMGLKSGCHGMEIVTMENGALVRSIHGYLEKNNYWFNIYGTKGRLESARRDACVDENMRIYVNISDGTDSDKVTSYIPKDEFYNKAVSYGHGGSDFYTMWNFIEKIKGNPKADTIDVFEAMDMFLPGHFAYRSILAGNIPMNIPNFRNVAERDAFRNDTLCTDPKVAGDMLVPSYGKGDPEIPMEIYKKVEKDWEEKFK